MFDYSRLRGRIVERYGSMTRFSKAFGISKNSMSLKFSGKTGMSQKDISKMSQMLDIPNEETGSYFFTQKV